MTEFYVDLHVHIGCDSTGRPVKVSASRELTFENIAKECFYKKGVDIVGIVDAASPGVIDDIESLLDSGKWWRSREAASVIKTKLSLFSPLKSRPSRNTRVIPTT